MCVKILHQWAAHPMSLIIAVTCVLIAQIQVYSRYELMLFLVSIYCIMNEFSGLCGICLNSATLNSVQCAVLDIDSAKRFEQSRGLGTYCCRFWNHCHLVLICVSWIAFVEVGQGECLNGCDPAKIHSGWRGCCWGKCKGLSVFNLAHVRIYFVVRVTQHHSVGFYS